MKGPAETLAGTGGSSSSRARVILHVDMDAFYAAVEVREDPSLAGKPLIIGHDGRRGVVSTCSYEARRFGVRSAMPSITARRLCPDAIWLPGRMSLYVDVSRRIRTILDRFSPLVEPLSIDEAFLDLTGIARDLEAGRASAAKLKSEIRREEDLSASVGVAPTKYLAKLASDLEKPDGLVVFPLEEIASRLWPLPVERLWGVGPKTAARLRGKGIDTIGRVLETGERRLVPLIGVAMAGHIVALARGDDPRRVVPGREAKSISEERTYEDDVRDTFSIETLILERSEGVARALRHEGLAARTVHLKVRTGDFETWTRSLTLQRPTFLADEVFEAARELFRSRIHLGRKGVRLLGVGASQLVPREAGQEADLFDGARRDKAVKLAAATDRLEERYGPGAVRRARLVGPGKKKTTGGGMVVERTKPKGASSLPSVD